MAGFIKGITIEFGADTTKLNTALKKTQGTLNKTQAELKQINRSLKFNPGNTTLLKQKFDLLKQSVNQTEEKLKQLRNMQKTMDTNKVDKNSAAYRELQREILKTENNLKQAQNELRQFGSVGKQQALAVGNAFKTAGNKIKSAGRTITTSFSVYGLAGIYAGGKLIEMSQKQTEAEDKLAEIYKSRMGVGKKAVKSTLALASAEQKIGVVGDEVQLSAAQQLATYAKYPETVNTMLPAVNDLLVQQKGMNATQEDATSLANLFGKAMMGQTGALKKAGISFTEAQEEVLKYGTEEEKAATIAEVVKQNVGDMNEAFAQTDAGKIQQAKNELGDMGEEIGAILLPAVADLVSWFQVHLLPVIQNVIDWFSQHPKIATFALALASITAVAGPLIMIIGGIVSAIGAVIPIVTAVGGAFTLLAGPVGIVVAAIAAAIAIGIALYKNWDVIKAKAVEIWTAVKEAILLPVKTIKTTVQRNFTTLKNTISTIWTNIKTKVQTVVTGIATKVASVFNSIKAKATAIWNAIKRAITKPIDAAKTKIKQIIEKIKSFFPIRLKKLVSFMLPSINIGSKSTKVGDKNVKSPTFGVGGWKHYAKAANNPYLFRRPTGIIVGDAAQDEIVYGRNSLLKDISQAVGGASLGGTVINVYGSNNMDVNELALAVEQRIITMQKRRSAAWA